jgi:hypothetical protein
MLSGLGKPGALPLLALIVFSLLTLVPSLSSIYNLKLADFSFYPGGARRKSPVSSGYLASANQAFHAEIPLLQDGMTEAPTAHPLSEYKPWTLSAPHRSRVNLSPRTARVNAAAAISASETTAVANKSRLSSLSRESSFSFSHKARAFRTYFIQQLDDYPFLTSFSNPSLVEPLPNPTATLNQSSLPTSNPPDTYNHSSNSIQEHLHLPIREMCQQACLIAIEFATRAASHGTGYAKSIFLSSEPTLIRPNHEPQTQPSPSEQAPAIQKVGAEDSTDAAAGRHSQELHGSCMAVVIGLVAGIMWF